MKITNLVNCTGCGSCYSICPKSAITMIPNKEGFKIPIIDESLCIKCFQCEKVCQVVNPINKVEENTLAYAVVNKDSKIRQISSSGGVFSLIAKEILHRNGIVFGASFDENFSVRHIAVDSEEELEQLYGSKYVQSDIGDCFKKCKEILQTGRYVLFSGTPCQISGLLNYLGRPYDNLVTVDLICHGVPSQKIWQKYLNEQKDKYKSDIKKVSFRNKDHGWGVFRLKIEFLNGKVFSVPQTEGSWMLTFNKDIMMRSSCYACASKGISRRSDFTIGDLWGINEFTPELNDNKGTSLVYLHSEKALKLFDNLKKQINFKKFDDIKAPCKYNAQLINSLKLSTLRDKYFSYTENHSFDNAFNTFVRDKWFIRWVKFIRKCLSKCKQLLLKIWRKVK